MPDFAANLSLMFNEVPLPERFARAAECGFRGVEILFPYEMSAFDTSELLTRHGLTLALFNIAPGDWAAGDRGLAAQKGREDEFEARLNEALRYADTVGCMRLHAMAGTAENASDETFIGNLAHAARMAEPHGIDILIEPINPFDMPGYHLTSTDHARRIIEAVAAPNVGLQFDLYHRQRTDGDAVDVIEAYADLTRHYQIAGAPARNEPDTGDIDFGAVLERIEGTGYRGWIGCEYRPRARTEDGLRWLARLTSRR